MALTFEAVIHPLRKVRETRGQDVYESVSSVSFLMFWLTPQVFIEPRTERWHGARPNCARLTLSISTPPTLHPSFPTQIPEFCRRSLLIMVTSFTLGLQPKAGSWRRSHYQELRSNIVRTGLVDVGFVEISEGLGTARWHMNLVTIPKSTVQPYH